MGHKWMWNPKWGGLPPEEFLVAVDPLFAGVRAKMGGEYLTSDKIAGRLSPKWAEELGLRAGIPIPVGAFDAHWDAIGSNIREGDVVNVVGTSTCIIAMAPKAELVPGVCGVVPGSVHPALHGNRGRACPQSATSSTPSPAARIRPSPRSQKDLTRIKPDRPACCA